MLLKRYGSFKIGNVNEKDEQISDAKLEGNLKSVVSRVTGKEDEPIDDVQQTEHNTTNTNNTSVQADIQTDDTSNEVQPSDEHDL